jgi:glycosyltransferase involved in cell wall biosynthesis
MKISVYLPTANRPAMLRNALKSVAEQTALAHVAEVVVIENLGNRESESVCREFPNLPINYLFRDPPLPPGYDSFRNAMRYIKNEYMAILFDDDWWDPEHLECAMESLLSRSDAVAASCAYHSVTGEDGYIMKVGNSFIPWFAANSPRENHRLVFKLPDLLVASQIGVGFSFMTFLVKVDVWNKCLECMRHGNLFDVDRLISVEFGRHGTVVADMRPHIHVRYHAGQEERRLNDLGEGVQWWQDSTRRLLALAESEGIDLTHEFAIRMAAKKINQEQLRQYCCFNNIDYLIQIGILPPDKNLPPGWRRVYRMLVPPFLQQMISAIRHPKKH